MSDSELQLAGAAGQAATWQKQTVLTSMTDRLTGKGLGGVGVQLSVVQLYSLHESKANTRHLWSIAGGSLLPRSILMHSWLQHAHALLLAIASSVDNFAVGFSTGFKDQSLSFSVNCFIAVCNATGALLAASVGTAMGQALTIAPLLASLAFVYLGYQEVQASGGPPPPLSYSLALPMTLNNLAGGVAGGVVGINWDVAFVYALVASFIAMTSGYWIGMTFAKSARMQQVSSELLAAIIYFSLSLVTLYEAFRYCGSSELV